MEIEKALKLIKSQLKKEVIESKHFKDQCIERELDIDKVKEVAKTNKILGILEQSESLYKIWFYYEKEKDLNIIIRIVDDKVKFVTVFPCYSERRKR